MRRILLLLLLQVMLIGCSLPRTQEYPILGTKCSAAIIELGDQREEISCHPNGQVRTQALKVRLDSGEWVPDGAVHTWYENGQRRGLLSFNKGVKDGEWRSYYPHGQLYSVEIYSEGQPVGKWKYFDEEGNLMKTEIHQAPQ